ncbi:unnamed protein product [Paramecium primaurelia]|uniref:MORN repeat protein n=1 Tax=Paramecium primaurelia TaxID=5886 RepID=A0A8S1N2R7_PARPR|nr:unnamed protein product [Paramecium primaurelia]
MEMFDDTIRELLSKNTDIAKIVDLEKLSQQPGFKIEQTNSYVYIGQVQNGLKHGTGILKLLDSFRIYVGEWKNDKKSGLAYEKFQSGAEYFGNYDNNKQNGYGEYVWANGESYKGNWIDGKKSGYGEWFGQNTSYKGEWNNGFVEGKGVYQSENGDQYTGDFLQSMKHGLGEEQFANGDKYVGSFKNGKPDGYGEYYWKNGSLYQGFFMDGMRHGHGVWQSNTQGKIDRYEGAYSNDKKCGYGEFIWSNGTVYKGNYFDDYRQGYGEMYQNGVIFYKGEWDRGIQVEKSNTRFQLQQKMKTQETTARKWKFNNIDEIQELEEETVTSGAEGKKENNPKITQKNPQQCRMKTLNVESKPSNSDFTPMKRSLQLQKKATPAIQTRSRTQSMGNCKIPILQQKQRSNSNQINNNQKLEQLVKFSPYKQTLRIGRFKLQKIQL